MAMTMRLPPERRLKSNEVVILKTDLDSAFVKHEPMQSIDLIKIMLHKQVYWDWIRENQLETDVITIADPITFRHVIYVTAKMTDKQQTMFLLKYGDHIDCRSLK
jgi:hypothetical protein